MPCGHFSGIVFKRNNRPVQHVANLTGWKPLRVPAGETLSISACNVGNARLESMTLVNATVVPTLVGHIGTGARVRAEVRNCANVVVADQALIGRRIPLLDLFPPRPPPGSKGMHSSKVPKRKKRTAQRDTSLAGSVVSGRIQANAEVSVLVLRSANVRLLPSAREIFLGDANLVSEVINQRESGCVTACYEAHVVDSANVAGAEASRVKVVVRDAQLADEGLDVGCLGTGSFANVTRTNATNVRGVHSLSIADGELADEAVDALTIDGAHMHVRQHNVGNVHVAGNVDIREGELVDETVDVLNVSDSLIIVDAHNLANIEHTGGNVSIHAGELLDEVVDAGSVSHADVHVSVQNAGGVRADGIVSIRAGELVDETLDVGFVRDATVSVSVVSAGNVRAGEGVRMVDGELLDEVVDALGFRGGRLAVEVRDSANVRCVSGGSLNIAKGELLETVVDVSGGINGTRGRVVVEASGGAQLPMARVSITNGALAKPAVQAGEGGGRVRVQVAPAAKVACGVAA